MEYVIGFSIGCIFTGIVMLRYGVRFGHGIMKEIQKEIKEQIEGDK